MNQSAVRKGGGVNFQSRKETVSEEGGAVGAGLWVGLWGGVAGAPTLVGHDAMGGLKEGGEGVGEVCMRVGLGMLMKWGGGGGSVCGDEA